jgi:NAD(P)-dependent dehydrogenase (short-subunit alcohol dehydrogenase family)
MEPAGSGSIVNLSSIGGALGNCGFAYSAAKAALIAMTQNIAIQYVGKGIRCNAICPGRTLTELNTEEKLAEFDKEFSEICFRHYDMEAPPCDALDQAYAILYFAGDESKSTTGRCLTVDAGATL